MPKPTQEEINSEIETLRGQVSTVQHFSSFGDDNRAQIRAQIRVAEDNMDSDDIADSFDGVAQDAAFQMRDWMDYGEEESPSEGWTSLCK
jgi:hypothetical protein